MRRGGPLVRGCRRDPLVRVCVSTQAVEVPVESEVIDSFRWCPSLSRRTRSIIFTIYITTQRCNTDEERDCVLYRLQRTCACFPARGTQAQQWRSRVEQYERSRKKTQDI